MARTVSRRPLKAEARFHARVSPCGVFVGQSGASTGLSPSASGVLCQYHSTVALQTQISLGG
jgi:hypothetical protein